MAKRKTKKKPSDAPIIAAGLLGVGVVGTLIDKMNVFGNNPDKKWWWERIFAPPTTAMTVQQLIQRRKANARRARANRIRNQLIYPGSGAGIPLTRGDS